MSRLVVFILVALMWLTAAAGGEEQVPGFKPYLGLALPYPEKSPEWIVAFDRNQFVPDGYYAARLKIDKKGKVREVIYPADSSLYLDPLKDKKKDIRFHFLEGRELEFPLTVPVLLEYSGPTMRKTARLHFPISTELLSDTALLNEFFDLNDIGLPRLIAMPPVFYQFDQEREEPQCYTISALITLDEQGELTALEYPIKGQNHMTHQIQSSLIRAEFEPARIGRDNIVSEFFLTFRVFDNLRFPYSPFLPVDTTRDRTFTENFFMIRYLNPDDISICALPRRYGAGKIPMPQALRHLRGNTTIRLAIGLNGRARVLSNAISPGRITVPQEIVRLTTWYPAVNNRGERENYIGHVKVKLDGGAHIVGIPEWLK